MPVHQDIKSIRRAILISIVGFVSLFVLLACAYMAKTFLSESEHQLEKSTMQWANYVVQLASDDLRSGDKFALEDKLQLFSANEAIQKIDVYALEHSTDNFNYFAGYDYLKSAKTIGEKITTQEKNRYLTPVKEGDVVKFVTPVALQDQKLGYVYIELDTQQGLSFDTHIIIIFVLLILLLFCCVFFVSYRLENYIVTPLRTLSTDILKITQSKDYSLRISSLPYREAEIVAMNINSFLNRTERHITQLGLAEKQSLELNIELEDKVTKRTDALKESNQELLSTLEKLHQFQDQLVESEKMASLGDMVAGVAHEVNTPIGLGVTASTLLSDRLTDIKASFEDKSLKSSQLKKFLTEGEENVGIIYRNLKRAAELISSFKKVAVDQSSEEFRQFNFNDLLNEMMLTLAPQIKNSPYNITFHCPEELTVVSKPGPINQVLINLILNSITHGFDGRENGNITLSIAQHSETLHMVYQDDGQGIATEIKDKVFEPFTTTKRGEGGSGLGLHLVYNLVTQALGGNIKLESNAEQGTKFEIQFPISEQLL
ncbi:HAMP domain-containing sensor histidine kinase [Thalassotalea sp. 1_MG-2023]|uniref:sensor histidine kinase n=1 Tax=Thalassotalea sp. 1_MG-2023 TaxID=3062680 RepID=UPI0026E3C409|nr:HAMP domain-containing sensor histidine kinase [Thalassotalea sp. 1_MG-2023]MDO6427068.1 HAMP domain-containing sensor histidine kinase [Thalassotalea sp. 1_MG-2023]